MLDGYKTYLAAIAACLVAIGYATDLYVKTGQIEVQAVISTLIALAILFLRQGVKKAGC